MRMPDSLGLLLNSWKSRWVGIVCVAWLGAFPAGASADPQLESVLTAHRATIESIHSVHLQLSAETVFVVAQPEKRWPEPLWRAEWWLMGERERLHGDYLVYDGPHRLLDWTRTPDERRYITGLDRDQLDLLTLSDQRGMSATIVSGDSLESCGGIDPEMHLLFRHPVQYSTSLRRTLPELVRDSPRVEALGWENLNGQALYHLRCESVYDDPEERHDPPVSVSFWLDPAAGYLVRRKEVHAPPMGPTRKDPHRPPYGGGMIRHEVTSFHALPDGVFIPARIEATTYDAGAAEPKSLARIDVHVVQLNAGVSEEDVTMHIPAGLLVHDLRGGQVRQFVWGPGDAPDAEIGSHEDLQRLTAYQRVPPNSHFRRVQRIALIVGVNLLIGVLVAWYAWRRRTARGNRSVDFSFNSRRRR